MPGLRRSAGPEQALAIVRLLHVEDATRTVEAQHSAISEQELGATRALRARRPNLDSTVLGIPLGAELRCVRKDAVITVTGPHKVRLGDDDMSLTSATREALQLDYSVAPAPLWTFQGRTVQAWYEDAYGSPET